MVVEPDRKMRLPSIALAAVLLASAASPASHGQESRPYVAVIGDVSVLLCSERPSLGGACFATPANHQTARIQIVDTSGLPVGGAYRFEAADGTALARGSFCRSINAGIPSAATSLTVFVSSARSPLECSVVNGEIPGVGSSGEITVTWLAGATAAPETSASPLAGSGTSGLVGSATFGGTSCLTLAGAISRDAGRQRWLGAYWPSHPPNVGGVCEEEVPHVDLTIQCVETVGPQFYAHARGADNKTYLIQVWDGGLYQTDQVGVVQDVPEGDRCGAGQLPLALIRDGSFAVASSS